MKMKALAVVLLVSLTLAGAERALHDRWLAPEAQPDPAHRFWSAEWQAQYKTAWKAWGFAPSGAYSIPRDSDGLIPFANGYRVTTGLPSGDVKTVWMYGSSTLLSLELPASETIPSLVQFSLGNKYRVVNASAPGATVFNQRKRMEDSPVRTGDWVVFYDGLVDVEINIHRPPKQAFGGGDTCTTSFFALYHALCAAIIPARITDGDIERAVADYRKQIDLARQWAEARGARFLHVLQPHTFSVPDQAHERELLWDYPGLDVVSRRAWPAFQASETGLDLTHALDACKRSGECWHFPFFHVNAAANKVVAAEIAGMIHGS